MNMKDICPCPNLDCPNQGDCESCNSRHVRLGYLNYCQFQTMVPALKKTIDAHPDSPASKELLSLIEIQSQAYEKLMETHGLNHENQQRLLKSVSEFSKH